MTFRVLLRAAPVVAAFVVPTAHADDGALDDAIIVTATRLPMPQDDVLATTLVIDRATIEQSDPGDAGDLLRFHAGLDLARNGGPGQTTALFIRGANSNHTLVMVDGVRINPGTIGLASLQSIAPDSIERIEVVKGPRSALWGSDAIGGVINIITRNEPNDAWIAEAGYGAYDTQSASLNGGLGLGRVRVGVGVNWIDSSGFPTRSDDNVDRGFHDLSGTASLAGDAGPASVALRYWRAAGTTQYSDFNLAPVDEDFADSTLALQIGAPLSDSLHADVTLSRFDDSIDQNQSTDYLRTRRDTVDGELDWRLAMQTWSAGAMATREDASSRSYGDQFDAVTNAVNLYVQDQVAVGPHRALAAVGYTDHQTAGSAWTWNLEYGYTMRAQTLLYALGGTAFRAPDATDRYGYGGNPGLLPERSLNLEAGVRQRISATQSASLAWFRNDIHDLIEFVVQSPDPFSGRNENVDQARIEGIEASYEYASGPWHARIEAIHQDPRDVTTGQRLFRRADASLTVGVTRAVGRFNFGLDVLATGDRKDYGYPAPVTLAGYVLANLTARWQPTSAIAVSARLENVLNQQYELADNYNTPDRSLYVSVTYRMNGRMQPARVADNATDGSPAPQGAYSGPASPKWMGL